MKIEAGVIESVLTNSSDEVTPNHNMQQESSVSGDEEVKDNTRMAITTRKGAVLNHVWARDIHFASSAKQSSVSSDEELKDILRNMKENLVRINNEPDVPSVPWFPEMRLPVSKFFTDPEMHLHYTVSRDAKKKPVYIDEIFSSVDGVDPLRIWISGDVGCGKSTLLKKLLHEWAKGTKFMSKFELAILVPLRYVTQDVESGILAAMMLNSDNDRAKFSEVLKRYQDQILLLLDGYDEINKGLESHVASVIKRGIYPRMTVLVTSRIKKTLTIKPGLQHAFLSNQFMSTINSSLDDLCYKHVHINGIKAEKQDDFLELCTHAMICDETMESFSRVTTIIQEHGKKLCESPLNLLLINTLVIEFNVDIPKTLTELYKMMVTFLIQRNSNSVDSFPSSKKTRECFGNMVDDLFHEKRSNVLDTVNIFQTLGKYLYAEVQKSEIELFTFGKKLRQRMERSLRPFPYQISFSLPCEVLELFGKFALDSLRKGKLIFTERELAEFVEPTDSIFQLGFWLSSTQGCSLEGGRTYEPIHRSMFEFFAAYYLTTRYRKQELKEFQLLIFSLKDLWPQEGSKSLLFPFLAGLLRHEMQVVFNLLQPIGFQYALNFSLLSDTLLECDFSEELLASLANFMPLAWPPTNWSEVGSSSNELITPHVMVSGNIQLLNLSDHVVLHLEESINVRKVNVDASGGKQLNMQLITCDEINYIIKEVEDFSILPMICSLVKRGYADRFSLTLLKTNPKILFCLHQAITADYFENIRVHTLHCTIKRQGKHIITKLASLVELGKITALGLDIQDFARKEQCADCGDNKCQATEKEFGILINSIGHAVGMHDFVLNSYTSTGYTLDIAPIFRGKSSRKSLSFSQNIKTECSIYHEENALEVLYLPDPVDLKALKSCLSLKSLTCPVTQFNQFMRSTNARYWMGNKTITELGLLLRNGDLTTQTFRYVKQLENLRELMLYLCGCDRGNKTYSVVSQKLMAVLKSNHQPILKLWNVDEDLNFVSSIVGEIERTSGNNSNLQMKYVQNTTLLETLVLRPCFHDCTKNQAAVMQFMSILCRLREPLKRKVCNCISIVCDDNFSTYLQIHRPCDISSFADIFRYNEGFEISFDFYGSSEADSFMAKHTYRFYSPLHQYSIYSNST